MPEIEKRLACQSCGHVALYTLWNIQTAITRVRERKQHNRTTQESLLVGTIEASTQDNAWACPSCKQWIRYTVAEVKEHTRSSLHFTKTVQEKEIKEVDDNINIMEALS